MAENAVPITTGTGSASIAGDLVSGNTYQQIKVVDGTIGGSSPLVVNANGSIGVSVLGAIPVAIISGGSTTPNQSVSGTVGASVIGNVPVNVTGGSVGLLGGSQNIGTVGINSGSIIGIIPGSIAAVIIGGSIAASFTPPANQSVSGTVTTVSQGSIATVIIGGSIAASFTPPANQSVSGTVTTISQGSIAAVIIGGSIAASFTAPPNQSVSGTVTTISQGSVAAVIIGGSISASFTPPANQSVSGTVTANQGTNPWIITGSVQATLTPAANQSVSGTVGASVIGLTPVAVTNTPSISGTVLIGNTITINSPSVYGNISGSVVTFQGGTVITSITGTPAVSVQGTVFVSGSVITVGGSGVANQSVSGTVGASIIGLVPVGLTPSSGSSSDGNLINFVLQTNGGANASPFAMANYVFNGSNWDRARGNSSIGALINTGTSSVVVLVQGSVATVGVAVANQSVSGTIGASIIGQLPGGNAIIGAVAASISGIVNMSGSVVGFQGGTQITSVSGTVVNQPFPTSSLVSGVTSVITGTTSVQVLAPAAAGQRNYISNVLVTNAAAVGTTVQLYDGGNVIYVGYAAASGGGFSLSFPTPLRQSSIAGNLSALSSIQASVYVSASGYTAS